MALHIVTDKKFEKALEWISKTEKKSKAQVVRELVFEKFKRKKSVFKFGVLKELAIPSGDVAAELKNLDEDHDLD